MKLLLPSCLIVLLCLPVNPQARNNWPHPPQSASQVPPVAKPKASGLHTRADALELQCQAKELLALSQSLQPDMEAVNHGLLPKDTIEKLKRIEKTLEAAASSAGPVKLDGGTASRELSLRQSVAQKVPISMPPGVLGACGIAGFWVTSTWLVTH